MSLIFIKKTSKVAAIVTLVISTLLYVPAQEMTFDAKLIALKRTAIQQLKVRKMRAVTIEEWFENESEIPLRFEKSISENLPPGRSRFVCEVRTANRIERTEDINVGGKLFFKYNDGKWKEFSNSDSEIGGCHGIGNGDGAGNGSRVTIEATGERKYKKGEIVDNQTADLYETILKRKYTYLSKTYTSISREAFWFDNRGRYVKTSIEFQDGETKKVFRKVTKYKYNPTIKNIKLPIIKSRQK